jgi:hypothetical protein
MHAGNLPRTALDGNAANSPWDPWPLCSAASAALLAAWRARAKTLFWQSLCSLVCRGAAGVMNMKLTAVLFSLGVASVASYGCPDHSTAAYSPEEYFGDCQCNDGYTKNGNYGCDAVPTPAPAPPSPTPEPTQGPALTTGSCVGAGPWANDPNMGAWYVPYSRFYIIIHSS